MKRFSTFFGRYVCEELVWVLCAKSPKMFFQHLRTSLSNLGCLMQEHPWLTWLSCMLEDLTLELEGLVGKVVSAWLLLGVVVLTS